MMNPRVDLPMKKKRPKYEWLVLLVVMAVASGLGYNVATKRESLQKTQLLQNELSQLRTAVTIYKTLNKANPPNLNVLTMERFNFAGTDQTMPYVSNVRVNPDGHVLDPFGQPYAYDAQSGWVASVTDGFQNW